MTFPEGLNRGSTLAAFHGPRQHGEIRVDGWSRSRYFQAVIQEFLLRSPKANVIQVAFLSRALPIICAAVLVGILVFPAVAVPGDGHWDRQFGMASTGTRNYALRFNGNLLYTGGYGLLGGQLRDGCGEFVRLRSVAHCGLRLRHRFG